MEVRRSPNFQLPALNESPENPGVAGAQRRVDDDDLYARTAAGRRRNKKPAGLSLGERRKWFGGATAFRVGVLFYGCTQGGTAPLGPRGPTLAWETPLGFLKNGELAFENWDFKRGCVPPPPGRILTLPPECARLGRSKPRQGVRVGMSLPLLACGPCCARDGRTPLLAQLVGGSVKMRPAAAILEPGACNPPMAVPCCSSSI